jgi:anti-sigma regulatory factor (Ser/Thr protein kinase)
MTAQHAPGGCRGLGPPDRLPPAAGKQCRITLTAAPESTREARHYTAATLERWGLCPLIPDAVIVASELVTNAIHHASDLTVESAGGVAGTPVGLAWQYEPERVVCVVTDRSHRPPVMVVPGLDAESGHGLQIVQALTVDWGWAMLSATEKAVWAALANEV